MMYDQNRARQSADQPRGAAPARSAPGPAPLLPAQARDRIARRLGRAVNTFPDTPRESLEEAEAAFDEATAHLVEALAEQRRTLRAGWNAPDAGRDRDQDPDQDSGEDSGEAPAQDPGSETRSAELHLALRQYREITQRLLRL
ncbi:hypothetical protein [Streptomyces sp. JW3]|uniref:hypothetical protein n=1 Tax=Streptomyces sp. JW3 TaxID=3456955 RepID=UPI003FA47337